MTAKVTHFHSSYSNHTPLILDTNEVEGQNILEARERPFYLEENVVHRR